MVESKTDKKSRGRERTKKKPVSSSSSSNSGSSSGSSSRSSSSDSGSSSASSKSRSPTPKHTASGKTAGKKTEARRSRHSTSPKPRRDKGVQSEGVELIGNGLIRHNAFSIPIARHHPLQRKSRSASPPVDTKEKRRRSPSPPVHREDKRDKDKDKDKDKEQVRKTSPPPKRLCIRNLTRNVTKEHLVEIFSVYGALKGCDMPMDRQHSHLSRGYGYVEFENAEDAEKSLKHMDGGQIDGQEITCEYTHAFRADRFVGGYRGNVPACVEPHCPFAGMGAGGGGDYRGGRSSSPVRFRPGIGPIPPPSRYRSPPRYRGRPGRSSRSRSPRRRRSRS